MDHLVLNRHVISTEKFDDIAPRVCESSDVIDNTFDGDFVAFQSFQRTDGRLGGCIILRWTTLNLSKTQDSVMHSMIPMYKSNILFKSSKTLTFNETDTK